MTTLHTFLTKGLGFVFPSLYISKTRNGKCVSLIRHIFIALKKPKQTMMGDKNDCEVNIPLVEFKESQVISSKEISHSEEISIDAKYTKVEGTKH